MQNPGVLPSHFCFCLCHKKLRTLKFNGCHKITFLELQISESNTLYMQLDAVTYPKLILYLQFFLKYVF